VSERTVLLAGGGHSHVEVLRRFGETPAPGVALVLVSPDRFTPYSGMLPGLIAGHYTHDEAHIDLEPLTRYANATFVRDRVVALHPAGKTVTTASGQRLAFDVASLDVGSQPDLSMPGAREHALGVKPVDRFLVRWETLHARARDGGVERLAMVGGGAGGVEALLAMHHRLRADGGAMPSLALVTDKPNLPTAAQRGLFRKLDEAGVTLHLGQRAASFDAGGVVLENGDRVAADAVVAATPATAAPWLASSGLACDARGFVRVDDHLRSVSHAQVFAAGDCASQDGRPHPRSGVYAVRQGPPLARNLRAAATGKPLERYLPQPITLALISTGGKHAVAVWGPVAFEGDWVWGWKDRIDRRFMRRYRVEA
jgi:selenide,water dikinase